MHTLVRMTLPCAWPPSYSDPVTLAKARRWSSDPDPPPHTFPWLHVILLAPAAAMAAAGVLLPLLWSSVLLLWTVAQVRVGEGGVSKVP